MARTRARHAAFARVNPDAAPLYAALVEFDEDEGPALRWISPELPDAALRRRLAFICLPDNMSSLRDSAEEFAFVLDCGGAGEDGAVVNEGY